MENSISAIACYLACLRLAYPVIIFNPALGVQGRQLLAQRLNPNIWVEGEQLTERHVSPVSTHQDLAVLLTTSGSTGGGKYVALSYQNLHSNATAICQYLPIVSSDIALCTMPLSYSYGLSVLNTHLLKGAAIRLTQTTVMDKAFWTLLTQTPVTSMSGVPSFYEMLLRLRFTRNTLPALRYFTQAGGKLAENYIHTLADYADNSQKGFYVMYGQTEATARMAYLPPEKLKRKPGSIGQAIPGGKFTLLNKDGGLISTANEVGELIYEGDNVMLGYCEDHADLSTLAARPFLATGDLAYQDEDGDFYLCGRLKRIIKLFGERLNLDGLESLFAQQGIQAKATGEDNLLILACESGSKRRAQALLDEWVSCPPRAKVLIEVSDWPLLANGKPNYQALLEQGKG
nr:AMP-binding protein [Alteromonas sp. C1M14]